MDLFNALMTLFMSYIRSNIPHNSNMGTEFFLGGMNKILHIANLHVFYLRKFHFGDINNTRKLPAMRHKSVKLNVNWI